MDIKDYLVPAIVTGLVAGSSMLITKGFPIDWKTTGVAAILTAIVVGGQQVMSRWNVPPAQSVAFQKVFAGQKKK